MKKLFVLVGLLVSAVAVQAQTVEEIVSKHVAAMGGADKLNSLKSVKIESSTQVMGQEFPSTSVVVQGKGMRSDATVMGMTITQAFDGTKGWMVNPMAGGNKAEQLPEDATKVMAEQLDLTGMLFNYKEKGNTVELLGKEQLNNKDVYKLKVTSKGGTIRTQYLDANTFLVQRVTGKTKMNGEENESEVNFSNYQQVDGYTFPFITEMSNPQFGSIKSVVSKIAVNQPVDEGVFKMPTP